MVRRGAQRKAGRLTEVHPRVRALQVASRSLSELVETDPRALELVVTENDWTSDHDVALSAAIERDGMPGLRLEKRRRLAAIAARDVAGELDLAEVGHRLALLADASLAAAIAYLAIDPALAVIAMGKLGGRELNYSSDIDLMFVVDDDADFEETSRSGTLLLRELGANAADGQAFRIDMNLRPEGRSGPLVRTLTSYLEYYKRWAQTWEFQALIKARAAAGDPATGERFIDETRPFVFERATSSEGVASIRKMKERVEEHATRGGRRVKATGHDVKLGPGGIRDIEFSVQLLQLVHGGTDPEVRSPNTLDAIGALAERGYIADEDAAGLSVDYRWLRNVEHRIQLWQERQLHVLPDTESERARIARSMGFRDAPEAGAAQRFDEAHRRVLADVRGRFEKLFYRPMVESLADTSASRLSPEALRERLLVLGFRDVERAAQTLEGLVGGRDRRAKLFRVLTPAMLRFLASTPQPDRGLFSFLRLGEALEGRVDALGALRDNPPGLEFLARVLGSGRFLGEVLVHVPEELGVIADPRGPGEPKSKDRLVREATASLSWRDRGDRLDGLRRFKRRETLKIALSDLSGHTEAQLVGAWLSDLASACLDAALEDTTNFAVIGMGKLGGRELNYSSDIDVMFLHDGDVTTGEKTAEHLLRTLGEVTPEGQAFRVDAALRPEGKSGPLSRSFDSYLEYYRRWSEPWEHQALIKARVVAGDEELGRALVDATRTFAFPDAVDATAIAQMRHLKARMEKERIPRGVDPRRHLKMGPGGIADVEFAVQLLQRRHAARIPELRASGTLDALEAAASAGLIGADDSTRLHDSYRFVMELRNRMFFIAGKPVDVLPTKPEELEAIGMAMGFHSQPRQEVEERYLRLTRRARKVAERLIYG